MANNILLILLTTDAILAGIVLYKLILILRDLIKINRDKDARINELTREKKST